MNRDAPPTPAGGASFIYTARWEHFRKDGTPTLTRWIFSRRASSHVTTRKLKEVIVEPMLKIKGLRKTYGNQIQALKGVNLEVPKGMFGLLGPNGAGKTTLMKILATLLEPDEGAAELDGIDLLVQKGRARRALGYLPQEFGLYPTLTAEQTLDYFCRLKGVADGGERRALVGALLEKVNLTSARAQKVGGFSGGMRQRLGIAQALVGRPQLIIVDEPTAG